MLGIRRSQPTIAQTQQAMADADQEQQEGQLTGELLGREEL
jgi:hypothetical protein